MIQSWLSVTLTRDICKFITRVQSTVMELKVVTNSRSRASIGLRNPTDVLFVAIIRLHKVRSNVEIHDIGFETVPLCCRYRPDPLGMSALVPWKTVSVCESWSQFGRCIIVCITIYHIATIFLELRDVYKSTSTQIINNIFIEVWIVAFCQVIFFGGIPIPPTDRIFKKDPGFERFSPRTKTSEILIS